MARWGLGWFAKAHTYYNFMNDLDTLYCLTAMEGKGKSALALSLAKYVDSSFEKELEKRLVFTEEDIKNFVDFQKQRAKLIEQGEMPKPQAFIIDEGQNVLNSRTAMTRKQKNLVKMFRTMRFTNSFIIICTPNILELDKPVLTRFNACCVVDVNKEDVFISLGEFGPYYGKYDTMLESLFEYKSTTKVTPKMIPSVITNICKKNDFLWTWDLVGKTKLLKSIYEKYRIIKASKALEIQIEDKKTDEEKTEEKEEKQNEGTKRQSLIDKIRSKLSNEIKDECFDLVTDEYYINCYYRKQVLSKIFGVSGHTINKYANRCRKKKVGNKVYIHLGDMLAQLEKI